MMSAFKILAGTLTGKRPLDRPRHRRKDSIRMGHKKIDVNTRNCIYTAKDRDYWRALVYAILKLHVP